MADSLTGFEHPLAGRYASEEMLRLFSPGHRYTCWHPGPIRISRWSSSHSQAYMPWSSGGAASRPKNLSG